MKSLAWMQVSQWQPRDWNQRCWPRHTSLRRPLLQEVLSQQGHPKPQNDKNQPGRIREHSGAPKTQGGHWHLWWPQAEWFQSKCLTTHALQPTYTETVKIGFFFFSCYPHLTGITSIFSSWVFLNLILSVYPSGQCKHLPTMVPNSGMTPVASSLPLCLLCFSISPTSGFCWASLTVVRITKETPFYFPSIKFLCTI